ncbi:MAG: MFS transporter [Erysipelotrichaceae bacterium]
MKHKLYLFYLFNFLTFFAFAFVNTQVIPYMTYLGYNIIQQGYILAFNALIAICFQFILGYLCDRYHKLKLFYCLLYSIVLLSAMLMFLIQAKQFYFHLIVIALMAGLIKVMIALNETWMMARVKNNYGKVRAFGAIGLGLGSPLAGYLITVFDYKMMVVIFGLLSIIIFLLIVKIPDINNTSKHITLSSLKQLILNKEYVLLVLIYLLLYMVGTADQYVVIDKLIDIGANSSVIGLKWSIQSFMEVPLLIGSTYLLKKISYYTLLKLGTIMYSIKFILYGLAIHPVMILFSASLQIVTLPIIMITSKILINKVIPKSLQSSGPMFAMAIFIGLSGLITPLITSRLCMLFGYDLTLYIIASFCIIPFLLIIYYHRTCEKK